MNTSFPSRSLHGLRHGVECGWSILLIDDAVRIWIAKTSCQLFNWYFVRVSRLFALYIKYSCNLTKTYFGIKLLEVKWASKPVHVGKSIF